MKTIPIINTTVKGSPLDTICDLKWNYPIFNMDRGEFRSCCRTPSNKVTEEELQTHGIDAFLNSPKMLQSRLDLIQGVKTSDCKTCWNIEDSGMTSPRHTPEAYWRHMTVRKQMPDIPYNEQIFLNTLKNITDIIAATTNIFSIFTIYF